MNPDAKAAARAHLAANAARPGAHDRAGQPRRHRRPRRGPARAGARRRTGRSCSPRRRRAADVRALARYDVVALVETAAGVVHAAEIAAQPNVVGLMWGAEDLVASLGGTSSRRPDGAYRDVARARAVRRAGRRGRARQGRDRRGAPGHRRRRRAGRRGVRRRRQRVRRDRVHPPVAGRRGPRGVPADGRGGRVGARGARGGGRAARGVPVGREAGRRAGADTHARSVLARAAV